MAPVTVLPATMVPSIMPPVGPGGAIASAITAPGTINQSGLMANSATLSGMLEQAVMERYFTAESRRNRGGCVKCHSCGCYPGCRRRRLGHQSARWELACICGRTIRWKFPTMRGSRTASAPSRAWQVVRGVAKLRQGIVRASHRAAGGYKLRVLMPLPHWKRARRFQEWSWRGRHR